jgi:hypothetical protein
MAEQNPKKSRDISTARWLAGMAIATTFCTVYFFSPMYIIGSFLCLMFQYPTTNWSFVIASPLILSIFTKPMSMPKLIPYLSPMADYFDYEEAFELSNDEARKLVNSGKRFIVGAQPHGVLSFCGMSAWTQTPADISHVHTAAAGALLQTPILKNVMGIFGLVDASKKNLQKHFKKPGFSGCLVLYVGGIAELFKSSRKEERLYLKKRKGFVKLALREGVDIVPAYMFGNTSVLTVLKHGPLAALSRKLQVSLTYFWGKYYLPIPRDDKVRIYYITSFLKAWIGTKIPHRVQLINFFWNIETFVFPGFVR